MEIGDRTIDLAAISVPTLVFAGNTDGIAPLPAVRAVVPLLTGSPQVRFEVVPGGHLGMLTGRAARSTTWTAIDEWVDEWSRGPAPTEATPGSIGSNPSRRYGSAGSRALGGR